jgi:hypothetical protein
MKNVYLTVVMIICFTTSLSNISYAADLTIKVTDSTTGETIYEGEKTYSPKEREEIRQREIMRLQLEQEEQAKQARGGLSALPSGSSQEVQLEYRRLMEKYKDSPCKDQDIGGRLYTAEGCKNDRIATINELISDPDYYFYKKNEADKHTTPKPTTVIDPQTGNVIPVAAPLSQ